MKQSSSSVEYHSKKLREYDFKTVILLTQLVLCPWLGVTRTVYALAPWQGPARGRAWTGGPQSTIITSSKQRGKGDENKPSKTEQNEKRNKISGIRV